MPGSRDDVHSFGLGLANAVALPADGGVVVVSLPSAPSAACFEELEAKLGKVVAIVAPDAVHTLGLAPWIDAVDSRP